jgi:GT2 family glycosyltransferase
MPRVTVGVAIVTFNSERYIERCLDAVLSQEGAHLDLVVVDNASTDNTRRILARHRSRLRLIRNERNLGFAAAQNQAIRCSAAPWILALNPDVLLTPDFTRGLIDSAEADPRLGTICGKLLSIGPGFSPLAQPRIDSTGIYFTPAMRHFDRGWGELDDGRYGHPEYVFGASAAAALYRRAMIDEISIHGEFFDPDFFLYREDADVAWRAQLLGWRCLYTPSAIAYHVRTVTPASRRLVAPVVNMHSVKNRFLMRIKNLTPGVWRGYWASMTLRDLMVIGGCVFTEPASLEAFWGVARCWGRAWRQRRWIMERRRASEEELAKWFQFDPASIPFSAGETCEPGLRPASGMVSGVSSGAGPQSWQTLSGITETR